MKRLPTFPLFAAVLYGIWLLLSDSLAPGQLLLGLVITAIVSFVTAAMVRSRARPHHLMIAIRLFFVVLIEIIRSNITVARLILRAKEHETDGFMRIPMDMRDPYGLAVLACIITMTPGTIWSGLSPEGDFLVIHVLDLQNEEIWVDTIKSRYERPLMKIFE